ncbi:MAG: 30S ribosomal protein S8 [Veillonella sp.]|nr:30S ribosomal protein S8 [Veillonella sp.]
MVMTDPIADMLTRIRNANAALHETVDIPASRVKAAILAILVQEGFIASAEVIENNIKVTLKYGSNKEKVITGIKRISKPGLRVYEKKEELPRVLGGLGIAVISTSKGVMSDKQARKEGLGGEVIAYVW